MKGDESVTTPCDDMIPDGKGMPLAWARTIVYLDEDGQERSSSDWMPGTSGITMKGAITNLYDVFKRQWDRAVDDINDEDEDGEEG